MLTWPDRLLRSCIALRQKEDGLSQENGGGTIWETWKMVGLPRLNEGFFLLSRSDMWFFRQGRKDNVEGYTEDHVLFVNEAIDGTSSASMEGARFEVQWDENGEKEDYKESDG
jgi:hypothetical protein